MLEAFLHDVTTTDSATFLAIVVLLAVTAVIASMVPTRAATRLDLMAILRQD